MRPISKILHARYQNDPSLGRRRVAGLLRSASGRSGKSIAAEARGATWEKPNWPIPRANGELVSALDGNWGVQIEKIVTDKLKAKAQQAPRLPPTARPRSAVSEAAICQQAARDSVRAIMMIRAYRMRGHLHADLDPLHLATIGDHEELHPSSYGFTEADYSRKIFIDKVLGLEFATIPEMLAILKRTYCSTLGVEFMHISDPAEKAWIQERIEGPDKAISFTRKARRRS